MEYSENIKHNQFFMFSLALIVFLGTLIYSNSLHGEFVLDDYMTIVQNPAIKNIQYLERIWGSFNTRFIVGLSFALNYWLGKYDVMGYHLFNLTVHLLASSLVYYFVILTFQTPVMKRSVLYDHAPLLALFSSLIFLCHPIQTQGVSYITQRAVAMATCFYLSSLIFYIKYRFNPRPVYYAGSLMATILGMLTKEMTITLPLMMLIYEFFFFGPWKENGWQRLKMLIPFLFSICIIPLVMLKDRADSVLALKSQILYSSFHWDYFLTQINVLSTYIRLLFFPINQCIDYDYPIAHSFFEASILLSIVLLIAILTFTIHQFQRNRFVSFALLWFFMTLSVYFYIYCFIVEGNIIYEHWLYLSMVGFAVFLPLLSYSWMRNLHCWKILMAAIVVICSLVTFQRNKVWQSEISLWSDNIKKTPHHAMSYFGLGVAYGRKGDHDKEIAYYEKGIALSKKKEEASHLYNNLGTAFQRKGDLSKAMECYQKAIALDPAYAKAYYNLSKVYETKGDITGAISFSQKAISLSPNYVMAYESLGALYVRLGKIDEAIKSFNQAMALDPGAKEEIYRHFGIEQKRN